MATEIKPFSPFWTQGKPGGSLILDRNLAAIKVALDEANATIIRINNDLRRVINGDTTINIVLPVPPAAPPAIDSDDDDTGEGGTLSQARDGRPGRAGDRGRDGFDADEPETAPPIPGPRGQAGAMLGPVITEVGEDAIEPLCVPPANQPRQLLAAYQFTVNQGPSATALFPDPYWLAAAHADAMLDADADDIRGYPFVADRAARYATFWVKVFDGDSATVDAGLWLWTFTLFVDGVSASFEAEIESAAGAAQLEGSSAALVVPSGSAIQVKVEGEQVSGGPSTTGALRAFVEVKLWDK